jgi:hypothetical protein
LKKKVIVIVFEGWARGLFEAGEFVPLRAALHLSVWGSYCRCHVSSPVLMEEKIVLSLFGVSKGQHKFQNSPPTSVELKRYKSGIKFYLAKILRQNCVAGCVADVYFL